MSRACRRTSRAPAVSSRATIGAGELEQRPHGVGGTRVGEQWPQPRRPRDLVVCPFDIAALKRSARRQGVRERALRVVVEAELPHGRARLLDEALDRGPVAAAERAVAALGERDHQAGPGGRAHADIDGLGEGRVGSVSVAAEEEGISAQHECGASHPASRTQPVERALHVTSHRVDAVPTLKAAKNGAPTRQRAAVGKDPLGRRAFCARASIEERRRRWMFRGNGPAFGRGRIADVDVEECTEHRDRGVLLDQVLVFEPREPTPDGLAASRGECPLPVQQHEPIDPVDVDARSARGRSPARACGSPRTTRLRGRAAR